MFEEFGIDWRFLLCSKLGKGEEDKEDNVYTVRGSEVVAEGCYHVAMVSNSTDWAMGSVAALASCISFRNHIAKTCLCASTVGNSVLVRDSDASVVSVEDQEEC